MRTYSKVIYTIINLDFYDSYFDKIEETTFLWWIILPLIYKIDQRLQEYDYFIFYDVDVWINSSISKLISNFDIKSDIPIFRRRAYIDPFKDDAKFSEK